MCKEVVSRICVIFLLLLLDSPASAQGDSVVYHRDATRGKALIDTYLGAFAAGDETRVYWQRQQIITYMFAAYDQHVYTTTLHYLHGFEHTHPDAVLALSDSLQAYWDSNYLQSYLVGSAAEYGKLKFLATLGMVGGGLGLVKNPLASFAALKGLNFLLPLAGGVGAYYAVEFFRQPLPDVPPEPQQVLRFARGARYFSYAQQRNDYLYRLFGVGVGLGAGEFIFQALGGNFLRLTKPSKGGLVAPLDKEVRPPNPPKKSSLFRPQASRTYFARAAGAILGIYLLSEGTHRLLRTVELRRTEDELQRARQDFHAACHRGDSRELLATAKRLAETTVQLVTLYEMPQLRAMVEFEQKFSQQAGQLSKATDEELRSSLQDMTLKLSKSLQAKLTRAMVRKNYHYNRVPLLHALSKASYTQLSQHNRDSRVTELLQEFEQEHAEELLRHSLEAQGSEADLDERFRAWVELSLRDRYALAQQTLGQGKLQRNIELLFQVAALFKASADEYDVVFLPHFYRQLLAKFQNMLLMYRNFAAIIDHNAVWQMKFSAAELNAVVDLYLDYVQADRVAAVSAPRPHQGQGREVLTSTRGFARFLAEYIAALPTKSYNELLLRVLTIYREQPAQRAALTVLLEDVAEKAELHDSYYDSVVLATLEGSFIGAGLLMVTRMGAKLMHLLGADVSKPRFRWIAALLGTGGAIDTAEGIRLSTRQHWTQLGKVALVGAAAGYAYYFAQKLRTHKLPPEAVLFEVQKEITLDLAYRACVLAHEVDDRVRDKDELQTYSAEQIQQEREALSALAARVKKIGQQAQHLSESAPSLRGNHRVSLPHAYRNTDNGQCSPQVATEGQTVVSITPLVQDIAHIAEQLQAWKRAMDVIEYRRLTQRGS